MKISVSIDYADVETDSGRETEGLCITCKRCGHAVEVTGIHIGSARYAAILLGKECPNNESNYYDVDWWT